MYPRQARLLRQPGVRHRVRPRYGTRRARAWLGVIPRRKRIPTAWLVTDADPRLGIPVTVEDADLCSPETAALIRGVLRERGHVALDFPNLVMWPTRRIERLPEEDASSDEGTAPMETSRSVVEGEPGIFPGAWGMRDWFGKRRGNG